MIVEITEAIWLDEHHEFSLSEFVALSGLSSAELQHLADCEALPCLAGVEPVAEAGVQGTRFSARSLALAQTASRLRRDFELDVNSLTLTLRLLTRIHQLEAELLDLRAQFSLTR